MHFKCNRLLGGKLSFFSFQNECSNKNGHRKQTVAIAGLLQWHISYMNWKKRERAIIVKPNKTPITNSMSILLVFFKKKG